MIRATWLACVLSLAVASGAAAQAAGQGSLRGQVTDGGQLPLQKVVITARNEGGESVAKAVTDTHGFYWLPALPPGEYVISAETGDITQTLNVTISVRTGISRVVDIVLGSEEAGEKTRTATVIPGPEAMDSIGSTHTSGEFLRLFPLSRSSSYADALFLVPGITSQQRGRSFVHGASPESTLVFIDGFDMNSNREGGTAYAQLGAEAVEDIEVKTASMDASVPLTQAAVINVAAKAGSNKVYGSAGVVAAARSWTGSNDHEAPTPLTRFFQPDLSVGGPILKGRWWFYGSGLAGAAVMRSPVSSDQAKIMTSLQSDWRAEEPSVETTSGFLKVTGQLWSRHRVTAFLQSDAATTRASSDPTGVLLNTTAGGSAYGARWSAAWPGFLLTEASVSYNDKSVRVDSPTSGTTALRVYRSVTTSAGDMWGSDLLATLNASPTCCRSEPASKLTASANLTWLHAGRHGSHEIGVGMYLQPRLRWQSVYEFNNNGFAAQDAVLKDPTDLASGFVPFRRTIYDQATVQMRDLVGTDNAMYVQDRWQAADRLTIVGGVRIDWIKETDRLLAEKQLLDTRAIGPRVSAVYALTARDVLRGGWGRVHEALSAARYVPFSRRVPGLQYLFDMDFDEVFETAQHYGGGTVTDFTAMDVHRSQPYVNEWTLDYGRQVGRNSSIGAALVRREFRSMPLTYFAPAPVGPMVGLLTVAADTWNYPVVTDLTVRAATRAGRLQFGGSYTHNFRHVAGTWVPNDAAATLQPDSFPNDKGIGPTSVATANSLGWTADTSNDAWVDHSLRLAAAWSGPWGLAVAGYYQVQSGPWSGPIWTGVDMSSPSVTGIRFLGPTRGDGQLHLRPIQLLNLRFGYRVHSEGVTLESAVDVFNPFNWDAFTAFQTGANWLGTPQFGAVTGRQPPRSAQVSLRVLF